MGLRDIEAKLPPGFRFSPSDEELVCYYLYKKITNDERLISRGTSMVEVDLHACEPWQLPDVAKLGENEWYFFSFRERKYATGFRTNRATTSGYWKATGKDKPVYDPTTHEIVGMRKTLVFYRDRAPNGIKTEWVMHEFRMENQVMFPKDWVLCRVFHKNKGELITTETSTANINNIGSTVSSSPKFGSTVFPNDNQTMTASGYEQQQHAEFSPNPHCHQYNTTTTASNPPQNSGFWNPNSIDYQFITQEDQTTNSRTGIDDFGFLYDMILDENALGI